MYLFALLLLRWRPPGISRTSRHFEGGFLEVYHNEYIVSTLREGKFIAFVAWRYRDDLLRCCRPAKIVTKFSSFFFMCFSLDYSVTLGRPGEILNMFRNKHLKIFFKKMDTSSPQNPLQFVFLFFKSFISEHTQRYTLIFRLYN